MPKAWFWERDEVRVVGEYIQPGAQSSIILLIPGLIKEINCGNTGLYSTSCVLFKKIIII